MADAGWNPVAIYDQAQAATSAELDQFTIMYQLMAAQSGDFQATANMVTFLTTERTHAAAALVLAYAICNLAAGPEPGGATSAWEHHRD